MLFRFGDVTHTLMLCVVSGCHSSLVANTPGLGVQGYREFQFDILGVDGSVWRNVFIGL